MREDFAFRSARTMRPRVGGPLNSDCSVRKRPGRHRRGRPGCAGECHQGRAVRPCVGLQPYRSPSRDRSTITGSAKKDALRRCITTRAIGTCELRRGGDTYAHLLTIQEKSVPAVKFFSQMCRRRRAARRSSARAGRSNTAILVPVRALISTSSSPPSASARRMSSRSPFSSVATMRLPAGSAAWSWRCAFRHRRAALHPADDQRDQRDAAGNQRHAQHDDDRP